MSTTHKQEVVSEAVCSALYTLEFSRFLGERDDPGAGGNLVTWFILGSEHYRQVRVSVRRENNDRHDVSVNVEWLNVSAGTDEPLVGRLAIVISTLDTEENLKAPTTQAVVRILEIYRDVLEQDGVAGPLENLAPEPEEETDPEDDMAVEGE